jgi:hypothetical protein
VIVDRGFFPVKNGLKSGLAPLDEVVDELLRI